MHIICMCYTYVFMCIDSIYAWTHTQIHVCMKINFIGKQIKNKVSYNFVISLFFSPHDFLSVGKLCSVVVGFPTILLSSLCITSPHWKHFLLGWHLCLHVQFLYVHIHLCLLAMKNSTWKKFLASLKTSIFMFFLCLEPVVLWIV